MVADLIGDAMKGSAVEKGLGGAEPGAAPSFLAIGNMYFDSMEDFQNSFDPNAEKLWMICPISRILNPSSK